MTEINKDFYCSAGHVEDCPGGCVLSGKAIDIERCLKCVCYHRKWPIPSQFKAEYGYDWPEDAAVYQGLREGETDFSWSVVTHAEAVNYSQKAIDRQYGQEVVIVCACTPYGKPPPGWRPE